MPGNPFNRAEAVLLDIDGTLVDSNDFHAQAWAEAFGGQGVTVDGAAIRIQIGKGADHLVPTLAPGVDETRSKAIAKAHDDIFRDQYLGRVQPFAKAAEFVAQLKARGFKVVLASSAKRSEVDHYVALLGIGDQIAAITTADDVEHSKPAGDIFAAALTKIASIDPVKVLVVGDTPYDCQAATRCELYCLAVLSGGFSEHMLRSAGAREVHPDVCHLLTLLNERSA